MKHLVKYIVIILILIICSKTAHAQYRLFPRTIYADSLINTGYYKAIIRDSLIINNEFIKVLSYNDLLDYIEDSTYSKLTVYTKDSYNFNSEKYGLLNRYIILDQSQFIQLNDIDYLRFSSKSSIKNSIKNSLLFGSALFLSSVIMVSSWEGLDTLFGSDKKFETDQVLLVSGIFSSVGFIVGASINESLGESVRITFRLPLTDR